MVVFAQTAEYAKLCIFGGLGKNNHQDHHQFLTATPPTSVPDRRLARVAKKLIRIEVSTSYTSIVHVTMPLCIA